jgi:hypothetical protein
LVVTDVIIDVDGIGLCLLEEGGEVAFDRPDTEEEIGALLLKGGAEVIDGGEVELDGMGGEGGEVKGVED